MKELFGPYASVEDTIKMIKNLKENDYDSDLMTVLANLDNPTELEEQTDANLANELSAKTSWKEKVKHVFTNEADYHRDITDELAELDLSDESIAEYIQAIVNGSLYIIANDGNQPPDQFEQKTKYIHVNQDINVQNTIGADWDNE